MEENQYAVIAIKYLLNLETFQTEKQFEVLATFKNIDEVDGFVIGYSGVMEKLKDTVLEDGKMLTSVSVEPKEFDGSLTLTEIKEWVNNNCSYEWGKNWKEESPSVKR